MALTRGTILRFDKWRPYIKPALVANIPEKKLVHNRAEESVYGILYVYMYVLTYKATTTTTGNKEQYIIVIFFFLFQIKRACLVRIFYINGERQKRQEWFRHSQI